MAKTASTKQGGRHDPAASDRRRQARAAQQAALARAKRRRALTQVAIIGGVAVVVVAIIATAVLVGRRGDSTAAGASGGGPSFSGTTSIGGGGSQVPLAIGGSQAANGVRVGSTDAKVTMDLWVDYSCPHCQEFEATNNAAISDLVASGKLAVTYHNIQIVTDYGTEAGSASACVAVHDPSIWPAFNASLYANHSAQTDGWSASQFASFATSSGAGDATRSCITDGTYRDWIGDNTAASVKAGVKGTPTMFINGQQTDTLSGQALTDRVNALASA
ncbi:Protein-disulfide isomerase [Microlunatus sagamiharensis]|uniref:Protein-disulfide isomerase n=1 Tax=Microlunatus sagamiharensis TaxID=546874 RepID=A0A1H2ND71_9ACTN|nr:thioredoxin domain-containing protein [Microlunatus sagamiharensis]SDV03403.1 Protein-disulfide isomerase [Microlunatus sagamiharensis]